MPILFGDLFSFSSKKFDPIFCSEFHVVDEALVQKGLDELLFLTISSRLATEPEDVEAQLVL